MDLVAIPIDISDDLATESVDINTLPRDWRAYPAPPALARIGESWFQTSRTAVLHVPSVIIPHERNVVLNPTYPDFERLSIGGSEPFSFDPRMWRK